MHATEVLDIEVFIFSGRLYLAKVKTRCLAAPVARTGVGLPGQNEKQQRIPERQMLTTLLAAEDHVAM